VKHGRKTVSSNVSNSPGSWKSQRLTSSTFTFTSPGKTENHDPRSDGFDIYLSEKDVLFIGNTGLGKSFLAKCIAFAATQRGIKTLFTTAMDMINLLTAADVDRSLYKKLRDYQTPDLLIIDEVGYLPLGVQGSNLFFQVISARHQKKSTMITSNLVFAEWGNIFDNTTVATAIADRLVHNSEVIIMEGPSYRTKNKN